MATLQREKVEGFDAFLSFAQSLAQEGKIVYALFKGSVDPETGSNWCPDCVKAEPVIEEVLNEVQFDKPSVLVTCTVGDRSSWKDMSNPFRTHPDTKLTGVPTLMEWKTAKRVGDEDCAKKGMVSLLFEED